MPSETFIDTSGFYAVLVSCDDQHTRAAKVFATARKRRTTFVTTDYVLDETLTLLGARGARHVIAPFLDRTLGSTACRIEWTGPERFSAAAALLVKHADQDWSFTDCVSFVVMKELSIARALTKDRNFEQAGFGALLR